MYERAEWKKQNGAFVVCCKDKDKDNDKKEENVIVSFVREGFEKKVFLLVFYHTYIQLLGQLWKKPERPESWGKKVRIQEQKNNFFEWDQM